MPKDKDLKRRVRERMSKTGEAYTAARAQLLARQQPRRPPLPDNYEHLTGKSDETMIARTGKSWPEWVSALDAVNAHKRTHREIANLIYEWTGLGWWAQMVTVGYERIRGIRDVGQTLGGGYVANKSKTFAVPVARLYRAFTDTKARRRWLDVNLKVRKATPNKIVRITWPDETNVLVSFVDKGAKSVATIQHERLPSRAALEEMKALWGERLTELQKVLQARR